MKVGRAIRAAFLPHNKIADAIAERVRGCARPDLQPADSLTNETRSDYLYWEHLASRFVSKQPDDPDGWIVLGYSRFHLDDFEGGCKAYREATRLRDNAATWFSLGLCAKGDEQIEAYREALRHNAMDELSWHYLGNAYEQTGNHEEAIRCFKTALKYSDRESAAWVLCHLGLCYLLTQQKDESIAAFERSVRADKGYAFDEEAANIADACLAEPPEFAHAIHRRLKPLAPDRADFFLKCFNARLTRKQQPKTS